MKNKDLLRITPGKASFAATSPTGRGANTNQQTQNSSQTSQREQSALTTQTSTIVIKSCEKSLVEELVKYLENNNNQLPTDIKQLNSSSPSAPLKFDMDCDCEELTENQRQFLLGKEGIRISDCREKRDLEERDKLFDASQQQEDSEPQIIDCKYIIDNNISPNTLARFILDSENYNVTCKTIDCIDSNGVQLTEQQKEFFIENGFTIKNCPKPQEQQQTQSESTATPSASLPSAGFLIPSLNADVKINFPPNSGNPVLEDTDPDNSYVPPSILAQTANPACEPRQPPSLPPPISDNNKQLPFSQIQAVHLYVLQNKVGDENKFIGMPYISENVDDHIRGFTGYFWYFDERYINIPFVPVCRAVNQESVSQNTITRYLTNLSGTFSLVDNEPAVEEGELSLSNITIPTIIQKIQELQTNVVYTDRVISFNTGSIEKQSVYNYYIPSYERLLKSEKSPDTHELPNYYFLNELTRVPEQDSSNVIKLINTLYSKISTADKTQYYDKFSEVFLNTSNSIDITNTKNIIFETDYKIDNSLTSIVPFYNKLTIDLEQTPSIILNHLKGDLNRLKLLDFYSILFTTINKTENYAFKNKVLSSFEENKQLVSLSLQEIIDEFTSAYNEENLSNTMSNFVSLSKLDSDLEIQGLFDDLEIEINELENRVYSSNNKKYVRSLKDIFEGKPCYSETLFYKIEKYEEGKQEVIQNFFFYNNGQPNFSIIDSQIKYNTKYDYVVKAYKFVYGNEYLYTGITEEPTSSAQGATQPGSTQPLLTQGLATISNPPLINPDSIGPILPANPVTGRFDELISSGLAGVGAGISSGFAGGLAGGPIVGDFQFSMASQPGQQGKNYKLNYENKHFSSIVEVEYARISGVGVVDNPPPAPEIDIVPFKDNDKKVLILFNPSTVTYKKAPISFTQEEKEFYERTLLLQNSSDGMIKFGGDDKTEKYYVYRIEKYPSSYEDFYDAFYREVPTLCNCTTAEYFENIEANKKYYYVFRSVDVHGHVSYPSAPFMVELISENGLTFLDFRSVEFINNEYKKKSISAKRFVYIKPNLIQSTLNVLNTHNSAKQVLNSNSNNYRMGPESNSIWNKNYKLKIKSKNTNKEINIKFKFVAKANPDLMKNSEESCE